MDDSRQYSIFPNDLSIRAAYTAIYDYLRRCGYTERMDSSCREVMFEVNLADNRTLTTHASGEFLDVLAQFPTPTRTLTHCHWKKGDADIGVTISVKRSGISATVRAEDLTTIAGIHDKICEIFQARNPERERSRVSKYDLKPTIFLAHRFDDQANAYYDTLTRFLRRLGFDVLEGEGYEARDIPSKVAERIKAQDIFICLISEGDPTWILSETAYAKGLSKYIIVLLQDDLPFKKGIVGGDYEHIAFPKNIIEKTFSELLYALPRR